MPKKKKREYNDNNLAIAYYRYSSDRQETSNEQQAKAAHEYAKKYGLKIIKEYPDDAITGRTDKRPQFMKMLSEIDDIKPSALILWKTDRFSRDELDARIYKKIIRDAGCRIHYVAEPTPSDSPEDILLENMLEDMAAYYSRQLSVNVMRGQRKNYDEGKYLGVKLLGYDKEGEGRHNMYYVVDPNTAPIVQRIFMDYVNGKSMAQISEQLNKEGRRTIRGKEFTTNGIRRILKNRAYIGVYQYADKIIEGGMPALISKELFDEAQERLKYNKKFGAQNAKGLDEDLKPRFWLTGKLYCGECSTADHEEPMQGTSGTSKTKAKHYYYSCNDQHKGKRGNGCKKKPVRKEWIEDYICTVLTDFLADSENLASLAVDVAAYYKREYDDHGYLDSLKADLSSTETAIDNIIKAIIAGASGETINAELQKYEDRKKALIETIQVEEVRQRSMSDAVSANEFLKKYANANLNDPETRELILNYFVDKIYLYDDRVVVTCNYDDRERGVNFSDITKKGSPASRGGALEYEVENSYNPSVWVYRGGFALEYEFEYS